jgi:hypothetical protein
MLISNVGVIVGGKALHARHGALHVHPLLKHEMVALR